MTNRLQDRNILAKKEFIENVLSIKGNYLIAEKNFFGAINDILYEIFLKYNKNGRELNDDKVFLLFKRIIEDMQLNMSSLITTNVEHDRYRYVDIKRNLRSTLETYIDMLNLFFDRNYFEVIKLSCKYR